MSWRALHTFTCIQKCLHIRATKHKRWNITVSPSHMDQSHSWVQSHSHLWFQRDLHHQTPPGWCRGLAWKYTRDGKFTGCHEKKHSHLQHGYSSVTVKKELFHWLMSADYVLFHGNPPATVTVTIHTNRYRYRFIHMVQKNNSNKPRTDM